MATKGRAQEIIRALKRHRGERHVVALQDYPDPDAISSGMAHQRISQAFDIQADLVHAGEVSHHENRLLIDLLGVNLRHPREGYSVGGSEGAVFVDNQGTTCAYLVRLLARSGVPAILMIDHHEGDPALQPEARIVENTGATATVYAELLRDGRWPLDPASRPDRLLASGLLYGILTDTRGLAHATRRDVRAATWLAPLSDLDLLEAIQHQAIPWETVEILRRALAANTFTRGFSLSGVGYLHAKHRDALPQVANWLLAQSDVHTAVVFGIVRDWRLRETITGSIRTILPDLSPWAFLHKVIGPEGSEGTAIGGRAFAGGFEILVGMSTRCSPMEFQLARWAYYEHLLLARLVGASGLTPVHGASNPSSIPPPAPGSAFNTRGLFQEDSPVWRVLTLLLGDREGGGQDSAAGLPAPARLSTDLRGLSRRGLAANPGSWESGETRCWKPSF